MPRRKRTSRRPRRNGDVIPFIQKRIPVGDVPSLKQFQMLARAARRPLRTHATSLAQVTILDTVLKALKIKPTSRSERWMSATFPDATSAYAALRGFAAAFDHADNETEAGMRVVDGAAVLGDRLLQSVNAEWVA